MASAYGTAKRELLAKSSSPFFYLLEEKLKVNLKLVNNNLVELTTPLSLLAEEQRGHTNEKNKTKEFESNLFSGFWRTLSGSTVYSSERPEKCRQGAVKPRLGVEPERRRTTMQVPTRPAFLRDHTCRAKVYYTQVIWHSCERKNSPS